MIDFGIIAIDCFVIAILLPAKMLQCMPPRLRPQCHGLYDLLVMPPVVIYFKICLFISPLNAVP